MVFKDKKSCTPTSNSLLSPYTYPIHTLMHISMHNLSHPYAHLYMHPYTNTYMQPNIHPTCTPTHTPMCSPTCIPMYTPMHTHKCTAMCTPMHTYVHYMYSTVKGGPVLLKFPPVLVVSHNMVGDHSITQEWYHHDIILSIMTSLSPKNPVKLCTHYWQQQKCARQHFNTLYP